jgi:uncharacterized membrane protein YjjB (DUF3815 family)
MVPQQIATPALIGAQVIAPTLTFNAGNGTAGSPSALAAGSIMGAVAARPYGPP